MVLCTSLFVGESQLRTRTSKVIASDTSRVLVTPSSVNLLQIIMACNVRSVVVCTQNLLFFLSPLYSWVAESQTHNNTEFVCTNLLAFLFRKSINFHTTSHKSICVCSCLPTNTRVQIIYLRIQSTIIISQVGVRYVQKIVHFCVGQTKQVALRYEFACQVIKTQTHIQQ